MQYSAEERETTCLYDYIDGTWTIYTCVPTHMTKLRKIADPIWEEKDGDRVTAAKWLLKSNQVRFTQEVVSKMTDEQKQAASLRLKEYNQNATISSRNSTHI